MPLQNLSTKTYGLFLRPASEIGGLAGDMAFELQRRRANERYGLVFSMEIAKTPFCTNGRRDYTVRTFYIPAYFYVPDGKRVKLQDKDFRNASHDAIPFDTNLVGEEGEQFYTVPENPNLGKAKNVFERDALIELLFDSYWNPQKIRDYIDDCVSELTGEKPYMLRAYKTFKQGFRALCMSPKLETLDIETENAVREFTKTESRRSVSTLIGDTDSYFEKKVRSALRILFLLNDKQVDWSKV